MDTPPDSASPGPFPARAGRPVLYSSGFVVLFAQQLGFAFAFSTFFLLPKFLARELAAPPSAIGVVSAMFGASGLLAIPLVGSAIDRLPRVTFLRVGTLLLGVTALGYLLVRDAGLLAAALRLVQGVAWAMVFTAGLAWTSETVPPSRLGEALGVVGGSNLLMQAIAPAVVEPLADRHGFSTAFVMAASAAAISTAFAFKLAEPVASRPSASVSLLDSLRQRTTWLFVPIQLSAGVAYGVMFTFALPFALTIGIHEVRNFFVAYTAAALVVRFGLGSVTDRMGRRAVSIAALVLYGASVAAMQRLSALGLPLLGASFGIAHGFFFPAINALILERARAGERGKILAIANGSFSLGGAAVFGFGVLIEHVGYPPVFWLGGSSALVGALLLLAWPRVAASSGAWSLQAVRAAAREKE